MGSLNINYIRRPNVAKSGHLYCDLHLDIENDYKVKGNFTKEATQLVDIKVSYDEYAIRNSLNALLNTNPGQRLLLPEFGVNLKRYIFSPVSDVNAEAIGEFILQAIERWEPRVSVEEIKIVPNIDAQSYEITLDLYIPSLGKRVAFVNELVRGEGFTFN